MTTVPAEGRIVVAGAGLGGLRSAERLRAEGFRGEIVVIGEEAHLPYNRPPLTKDALAGRASFESLEFRRRRTVDDVTWRLTERITGLDLAAREVAVEDAAGAASTLAFDGLVIATGLRSRRLDLPGPTGGRYAVRTIEDAAVLKAALRPDARVVVIGAGFIGCEVAATAVGLGCRVDVVAPEQVPMQRPLGVEVGSAMQRLHESHGVRMHLGRLPVRFEAGPDPGRVAAVVLDDGTHLAVDVVLEALGSLTNIEWLVGSGLDVTDGVLTDGWLRAIGEDGTTHGEVVAVGDVARFPNALVDDVPRRVEHWSIPTDTARRAAPSLLAHLRGTEVDPAPFAPLPSFWTDQHGITLQSFGSLGIADSTRLLDGAMDGEFVVGYLRDGVLVGLAGIGSMEVLMRLRDQIGQPA